MVSENPVERPSASTIIHHPCICPDAIKSKAQLRRELYKEKFKNELLKRELKKYKQDQENETIDFKTRKNMIGIQKSIAHDINKSSQNNTIDYSNKFVRSLSSTTF
jgi:hypothetical protein